MEAQSKIKVLGRAAENEVMGVAEGGEQAEPGINDKPRSVYELITRQMLEQLKTDVREVKDRVNTLLWLVTGALLLELLMRLLK